MNTNQPSQARQVGHSILYREDKQRIYRLLGLLFVNGLFALLGVLLGWRF